ncbi:hypothetical protein [Nocardioides alcanivorans]|uniref:hypothetical protein n=1 Tax=Nocardioides alcanivorans TaxID=2897352 RepID=UPI001F38B6DC|nr:hypothetical protein [Nocardioides alcanivorans]
MTPREQVLETLADFARATDARDWVTLQAMLHPESVGYGQEGWTRSCGPSTTTSAGPAPRSTCSATIA